MALEIASDLEEVFQAADASQGPLDVRALYSQLYTLMVARPVDTLTPNIRKGNFALVGALEFQPLHAYGDPLWQMHWQPVSSIQYAADDIRHAPDARMVDCEILDYWRSRAEASRHPVLRARFADLAWELARFRRTDLKCKPEIACAHRAIDSYLDCVERRLSPDAFNAWNDLARALELAVSINDPARVERAKQLVFEFRVACEANDLTYAFWQFDDIVWNQSKALALTDADRRLIIEALERQLAARSRPEDPTLFDPHIAREAADRLGRWRELVGESTEARRAAQVAGAAFESAAQLAPGLTAITWLGDQAARYRQLGDQEAIARVERTIRDRSAAAQAELKRISVPLEVKPEELQAWANEVAGATLDDGLKNFARVGLVGRRSSETAVLKLADHNPLSANISISIHGADGFPKAVIGSVKEDLHGRTVHHAAQLLSQKGPFLNVAWRKLQEKYALDLNSVCDWLSQSEFFPSSRMSFVREGIGSWLAGDMVKAVHVLVPQVEAALRDVLAALGGAITRSDSSGGGFHVVLLGDVLNHERFNAHVSEDIRFHMKVLYQDSRGLNLRNELAHGLAAYELYGLGLATLVVHSIVLVGTFRVERQSQTQPQIADRHIDEGRAKC